MLRKRLFRKCVDLRSLTWETKEDRPTMTPVRPKTKQRF